MHLPKTRLLHREGVWLLLILVSGLALRTVAVILYSHAPESDEIAYQSMAINIISGNGIVDSAGNRAMYNVGYPLFILTPAFYLFAGDILMARLANGLLSGLAILLTYAVAREANAGRTGRLLAAGLWAMYLPASVYVVYLAKENLMIPLMLGVIWCALRLGKTPSLLVSTVCGVLFGLLALTGNAALSLAAPVALALLLSPATWERLLLLSGAMLISAALVATPWIVRNAHVLGAPLLNTNGGFNLYLGNNPVATGMFMSIADTPRGQTWRGLREKGEVLASETLQDEAIAWIRGNPAAFVALALKKAALFWTPPVHNGNGGPSRGESVARVIWTVEFVVLLLGAVGSAFVSHLRVRPTAVLWLAIASYTAVHMLFYVIFRYREPIMPLVCVLAAMTSQHLLADRWGNASTCTDVVIPAKG